MYVRYHRLCNKAFEGSFLDKSLISVPATGSLVTSLTGPWGWFGSSEALVSALDFV
jgi:hypothetical protein